jgi:hypothetical protein
MIRTDGYYITEGSLYNERNDPNGNWYLFIAYHFNTDGTFIKASKYSKSKTIIHFDSNEFLLENSNRYKIVDDEVHLYFNLGLSFEHNEILKEFNGSEFIFENGVILNFHPWILNDKDASDCY